MKTLKACSKCLAPLEDKTHAQYGYEIVCFDCLYELNNINPNTLDLEHNLTSITSDIVQLVLKKNQDYGSSFDLQREKYGFTATLIRLSDKLLRLEQLNTSEAKIKESIEDSLKDLIGYALLELNYRKQND